MAIESRKMWPKPSGGLRHDKSTSSFGSNDRAQKFLAIMRPASNSPINNDKCFAREIANCQ
jgi:hypothetical protein